MYKENGITFKREYFMSYPDNVMVMRLTSDSKKGKLSRIISLESLHTDKTLSLIHISLEMRSGRLV